ncbi:MAG: methyl-accepting chemotaxis protein [Xanthomonadales bacterium]|nr:methyl-accepting chemotaxis protein [Xanthomonadales bacterium]
MRLKTKLGGLVAILLALLLGLAVMGLLTAGNSRSVLTSMAQRDLPLVTVLAEATAAQLQQTVWLYRGLLGGQLDSEAAVEEAGFEFEQLGASVAEKISLLRTRLEAALDRAEGEARTHIESNLEQLAVLESGFADLQADGKALLELIRAGDFMKAELRLPVVEIAVEDLISQLLAFNATIAADASASATAAAAGAEAATRNVLVITGLAFALALVMGLFIVRSVGTQLGADPQDLLEVTSDLADGKLLAREAGERQGVFRAVTRSIDRLREVVQSIKTASDQVGMASQQVLEGNADLSSRTQEQASSLEEVAASMEEMSGTVTQNADNAQHAESLAREARDKAHAGSEVVARAVSAMDRIEKSGERITEILELIQDIAFQTNLLALNAAVEAARAGEHGRGFAVVANEVRKLAGRSSTATTDIKELIQEINQNVADGTSLVNESGDMLEEIVTSVSGASDAVSEIAASSIEHSDGINQVKKAVIQMEEMTQQNAALVEEAAAASQSMGEQAEALRRLVAFFRLEEGVEEDDLADLEEEAEKVEKSDSGKAPRREPAEPVMETARLDDESEWTRF